jgi:hypothetical protein
MKNNPRGRLGRTISRASMKLRRRPQYNLFPGAGRSEQARGRHVTVKWLLGVSLAPLVACTPSAVSPVATIPPAQQATANVSLEQVYQASMPLAAVRNPGYSVTLRTIGPGQSHVTVGTFTTWGVPASPTQHPIWISLPDQLWALCHGKPDAVLAIEQVLGMPPVPADAAHQWQMILFSVRREALFRPCPGGTDIAAPRCGNDLSRTLDARTTHFLLDQMFSSYRVNFQTPGGQEDWGYPFTGMGWTYNWDPHAPSPVGVSEFIIRPGSQIQKPTSLTPQQFCGAPAAP